MKGRKPAFAEMGHLSVDDLRTDVPNGSTRPPQKNRRQYSRITNGKQFLPHVSGNSVYVRRCKDLFNRHLADAGGYENTSEAERLNLKWASVLAIELDAMAAKFATSGGAEPAELDLFQRTTGGWRRLWEGGMQRRPRDVTPTLQEFLAERAVKAKAMAAAVEAEVVEAEAEVEVKP